MALNTTGLSQHVAINSFKIATKAVAEAKTAKSLLDSGNYQSGVKGFAPILKMDSTVTFSSGVSCGRTVLDDTVLSDKLMEVVPIKNNTNICPKVLYNTYFGQALSKGQDPSGETISNEVVDAIIEKRIALVAKGVEDLIWKGDKAGTGNLKWIDGIRKQASVANGATEVVETGADTKEKLQSIYLAVPTEVRMAEDFKIYVGEDLYSKYKIELENDRKFSADEAYKLFGTNATLFPTSGLNGTGSAYALKEDNLQLGTDGDGEAEKFTMNYSVETEQWYQDVHFAVGISVVYPEQVYFATGL